MPYARCHRTFAKVDLDAITHNLLQLQMGMKPGVKTMAVVKADGYGHGSKAVASHIADKVDYFAVACMEEAIDLRDGGIEKPILILGYTDPACYTELVDRDIAATIYRLEDAKLLSKTACAMGRKAKIHVAVDTGMGRIGVQPDETGADLVLAVSQLEGVEIEGLFSHYACADCQDKTDAQEQTALFDRFIGLLEGRGVQIPLKHICNSAGAMEMDKQYDMCRLGIALYGLYPSEEVEKKIALIPAMEVISHVVHVKDVPQGFKIGYGHIYEAPAKRKIATVCVGYADGYNRCLTGVGYVLIRGKKAPVVGKVCMDQIMVDVTDIEGVTVGDQAVILGKSQDACISAEELGAMCHSFNYEVVCNFMPRVTRAYYKDGKFRQ
jgi:alanine racemase